MKKIFFPNFSNSCSLNIFEPKIWRRLGTFPSCFFFFSPDYNPHTDRSTFYNSQFCAEHLGQVRPRQTLLQRVPTFHFLLFQGNIQNRTCPKGPPFGFFSELCDFFSKFFFRKHNGMFVNKSRRVSPFTFFGTMRLLLKEIFFSKISIFFQKKCFTLFEP